MEPMSNAASVSNNLKLNRPEIWGGRGDGYYCLLKRHSNKRSATIVYPSLVQPSSQKFLPAVDVSKYRDPIARPSAEKQTSEHSALKGICLQQIPHLKSSEHSVEEEVERE